MTLFMNFTMCDCFRIIPFINKEIYVCINCNPTNKLTNIIHIQGFICNSMQWYAIPTQFTIKLYNINTYPKIVGNNYIIKFLF